jgi:putative peptidoglycan lipid II flippase
MLRGLLSFGSMTMVSRVFGLLRDVVINAVFGANAATDAFWVAFRIPNFMRRLFAEGSFSTAFVPVFTEIKETRSHDELKALVSRTAGTLGGVLLVIVALGMIFAPQVTLVFSPGAADEPQKFALTVELLRLTFPFLLFVSLTALAGGALNSFHRFGMPALTPVILNLCMIAGALWLSPRLQTPILALGWAILIAGILQLLFQLPQLGQLDLLSLPRWGASHPDVRKVMRLMVPTLFGSSVAQVNLLLDTIIASLLVAGSQTWLSQADRFLELPLGVFGIALGTVILPTLARHHVNTDHEGFSRALDWGLRTTLMIAVPAMLGLMLLSVPLVATLFQHGQFTAFDTRMAALSVFGLSFGLPAFALVKVVLPAFYARQDTRTPVKGRRRLAGRQHGLQRRVPGDPLQALGAGGSAAGFGLGGAGEGAGPAFRARTGQCIGELPQSRVALALVEAGRCLPTTARMASIPAAPVAGLCRDGARGAARDALGAGFHQGCACLTDPLAWPPGDRRCRGLWPGHAGDGLPPARVARALRLGATAILQGS